MKERMIVMGIFLLLFCAIVVSAQDRVGEKLEKQDTVGVLVKFKDSQSALQAKSKRFSSAALEREFNVTYRGKNFNGATMEISREDYEQLLLRSDVESVIVAPVFKLMLQASVPLVNSTATRQLQEQNVNITGAGQTICIIDSGVNYTHSALGGCSNSSFLGGNCSKVIGGYDFVNSDANPMDDNGHGTHVASIAAGQDTIIGVAPDAKIVALKACGAGGSCDSGPVLDSMSWCINNASLYNISVISMSLGDDTNHSLASECDLLDSTFRQTFASAAAKNISVVVATGNDGNMTGISYPSCLTNATSVSATDKNRNIASYSNRGVLTKIFAPGSSINASSLSGGFVSRSGTSMATPHAAGAIVMMKQYLARVNVTKTPSELSTILNSSGIPITDSSTGSVYAFLNIYDSVLAIDKTAPNLTLTYPTEGANLTSSTQTFNASFSDWQLSNATLIIWNSSGAIVFAQTANLSGVLNSTSLNASNLSLGNYNWTFNSSDVRGNMGNGTIRTFSIPTIITIISPDDGYSVTANSADIEFNFTLTESNITNCSLIINSNVTQIINITNASAMQNLTRQLSAGSWNWQLSCINASAQYLTSSRSITITAPAPPATTRTSSGGGGGGGGVTTFRPTQEVIEKGYTNDLRKQERIEFTLFDSQAKKHTLTVDALTNEYVNITVRSNPIRLTLGIGQSAKINLTSADFYDLYVKLEGIKDKKAQITIQTIYESRARQSTISGKAIDEQNTTESNTNSTTNTQLNEKSLSIQKIIGVVVILMILTAVAVHLIDTSKKK